MDIYSEDMDKIEDSLGSLEGKDYISESSIAFFRDIFKVQYKIKSTLLKGEIQCSLSEDEIKEKMKQGKPLISLDNIPLKDTYLKNLLQDICEIMKRYENSDNSEEIRRLIENLDVTSELITRDQSMNAFMGEFDGKLPADKERLLDSLERALTWWCKQGESKRNPFLGSLNRSVD